MPYCRKKKEAIYGIVPICAFLNDQLIHLIGSILQHLKPYNMQLDPKFQRQMCFMFPTMGVGTLQQHCCLMMVNYQGLQFLSCTFFWWCEKVKMMGHRNIHA